MYIIDEERTHTCKTLSLEDIFERYFTTAWVGLNEDDVIGRLRCLVCADPVLLNTSWFDLCQYQCKNYLHVNLKTVEWMDILKEQVVWKIVCVYKVTSENSLELSVRKWHPKWNLMLKMSVTKTDLKNIQTRVVLYSIVQRGLELLVKLHEGRKEMFYLTTHSTHFIVTVIWLRTILIVRKETRCRHIGYYFRLAARVLLYAPSHRQDSTYHGLCYTSRGALVGTRNIKLQIYIKQLKSNRYILKIHKIINTV